MNLSLHRPLVPSRLISRITGLFIGFSTLSFFLFVSVFSFLVSHLFLFFSNFWTRMEGCVVVVLLVVSSLKILKAFLAVLVD